MLCGTLVHKYEPLNGSGELYSSPRAQMNTYFSHVAVGCAIKIRKLNTWEIKLLLYWYVLSSWLPCKLTGTNTPNRREGGSRIGAEWAPWLHRRLANPLAMQVRSPVWTVICMAFSSFANTPCWIIAIQFGQSYAWRDGAYHQTHTQVPEQSWSSRCFGILR